MVRKILQCLPNNKWGPKVTVIEEAQDLKTLALNDLLEKLLIYEIHLKEDEEETQPTRGVASNSNEELQYSEDESTETNEDFPWR